MCNESSLQIVNAFMRMRILVLLLALITTCRLYGQDCTTRGQRPSTAFPVCGSTVFKQSTVPICETRSIPVPGCENDGLGYSDKNPFWYKFTCYVSGTLGFEIRPNNSADDYDWQLFDVTGRNPDDVFTDKTLVVTGNWSDTPGNTGTNSTGTAVMVCGSQGNDNKPRYSAMPQLVAGREYLLLVSHFTNSQSGYELEFRGGTAVITDPNPPQPNKAWAGCGGVTITVRLDKKLLCSSLAANGSDFTISPLPPGINIVSAVSSGCNNGFDMDTVMLHMSGALPPGNYTVNIVRGTDNNTLLDECNKEVPVGANIPFQVFPVQYTPMDSIAPPACAPGFVELVFPKPIWCGSVAPNGSDFRITGPTPVTITGAAGNCVSDHSSTIKIQLSGPIQTGGVYTVELLRGSDGNTILDECRQETPEGSVVSFAIKDTVNADFDYTIRWGCLQDTVDFSYTAKNDVNIWNWIFDNDGLSALQNPQHIFKTFGSKNIKLIVSNGFCSAVKDTIVNLDNQLDARFHMPNVLCPEDEAVFTDASIGKIQRWDWDFDNGFRSSAPAPGPQRYPKATAGRSRYHFVQLIVQNDLGCRDTMVKKLEIVYSCYIDIPNAFTPNNDFKNDYLYPLNAWKATNLDFRVYNRYGQLIFQSSNWTNKWDGTFRGIPQPPGAYVWTLQYTDRETGQKVFKKGSTLLIR